MDLQEKKLLQRYNYQGIFPFFSETKEDFFLRASRVEEAEKDFFTATSYQPLFAPEQKIPYYEWDFPRAHLSKIFDTSPHWIQAYYTKKGLLPWHGAMTWILEDSRLSLQFACIQLRYWYKKEEMLAHEAVHVIRASLESKKYEEIFAYMTAQTTFRKLFGPIFQAPYQAHVCLGVSVFSIFATIFTPFLLFHYIFYLYSFFSLLFLLPCLRLVFYKYRLYRACRSLQKLSLSKETALAILFRLRDEEIDFFARHSLEDCKKIILQKKEVDLRWQQIFVAYLQKVDWS